MKIGYALGATFASAVLGFCIAAAITAQASDSWYNVSGAGHVEFNFGLYRVCAVRSNSTVCYSFRLNGLQDFIKKEIVQPGKISPVVNNENKVFQNTWILSFFAIVFTGMAFILSVPTAILSYSSNIHDIIPKIQFLFTFIGTVLGVTSIIYAYAERNAMWPTGVAAIKSRYPINPLEFKGRGMLFQTLYPPIEFVAFIVYLVLMCKHASSKKK